MVAARRDRVGRAAALAVALVLLGGGSIAFWQVRAASSERAKAAQRLDEVRELTGRLSAERLQDALVNLDKLAKQSAGNRALMREVAGGYEKVAAAQRDFAADTGAALATREKAISLREQIAKIGRNDPADMQALADAYVAMSEFHMMSGAPATAIEYVQKAIPIAESPLASNATPEVRLLCARAYTTIARALSDRASAQQGDTRTALAYMRGALKMQQALVADFPENLAYQQELIAIYHALGSVYSAMGERDEELEQYRKAIAGARKLMAAQPDNRSYRRELAAQLVHAGTALMQPETKPQALEHFREALEIYDSLLAADSNDASLRAQRDAAQRNVDVAEPAVNERPR